MALSCGIIGLPNVGKSTIFNALTSSKADAANYPFCTIEPNTGIVKVPDDRLERISNLITTQKVIATSMTFVDIAGLVKGASKGEGLGNQFLGHIRETNALTHVVRCFQSNDIIHVEGSVDPVRDISIIDTELIFADLETVLKRFNAMQKSAKTSQDKKVRATFSVIEQIKNALETGKPVRALNLSEEQLDLVFDLHLITQKKVLYIANVDEPTLTGKPNPALEALLGFAHQEGSLVVPICGKIESELSELSLEEKNEFLKDLNLTEPGLHKVIRAGFELLGLSTYFTAGETEVRAWTILKGMKAPQAAGVIHSDFEKGFIKAEVYHFEDLMRHKSELAIKEAGLLRLEGKEYVVQDGDIMHFRFAV